MARTKQTAKKSTGGNQYLAGKRVSPTLTPHRTQKPRRYRPGTVALREIRKYQKSVKTLIPKQSFQKFVREIMYDIKTDLRIQSTGLLALQEAAEAYLVGMLQKSQWCAIHANRVTVMPKDTVLTRKILGEPITDQWQKDKDKEKDKKKFAY